MRPVFFQSLALAIILVVSDQLSKWAVTELFLRQSWKLPPVDFWTWLSAAPARLPYTEIYLTDFLNIVMVWNEGVSFGLFNQGSALSVLLLIIATLLITLILCVWLWRTDIRMESLALALVIGGAVGNIIDRIRFGAVIDFIDLHIGDLHWPAFNLADSAICVGVGLLLLYHFVFEKRLHEQP